MHNISISGVKHGEVSDEEGCLLCAQSSPHDSEQCDGNTCLHCMVHCVNPTQEMVSKHLLAVRKSAI